MEGIKQLMVEALKIKKKKKKILEDHLRNH